MDIVTTMEISLVMIPFNIIGHIMSILAELILK